MAKSLYRVLIGPKVDLDTITTAFLLGVSREDKVEVVRSGQASETDLADPSVICIGVGGAGRVNVNCFDHHEAGGPQTSATAQVEHLLSECVSDASSVEPAFERMAWERDLVLRHVDTSEAGTFRFVLARHVDVLDTRGPEVFRAALRHVGRELSDEFPTLSDIIAGMLLTTRESVEQLHQGVEVLSLLERAYRTGKYDAGRVELTEEMLVRYFPVSEQDERRWREDAESEDPYIRAFAISQLESRRNHGIVYLFTRVNLPEFTPYAAAKKRYNPLSRGQH